MTPLSDTLEAEIARNTTDKVYQRGEDYYEQGAVLSVVRRGELVQAEVEGSGEEPYLVSVTVGPRGIEDAGCTCPYMTEWDGWCKHVVAALLFCRDNPGDVEERPGLESLLEGLDRARLQALVLGLAGAQPRLAGLVEAWVNEH